jgi:uncharacterized FAD-dependent dehydrogenase
MILQLSVSPQEAADEAALTRIIQSQLGSAASGYTGYKLLRRSIDARKRNIVINLKVEVLVENEMDDHPPFYFHHANGDRKVLIAGAGPAGLFAALELLEHGIRPIIIERGKKVRDRRRDIAALNKQHIVNPDSNYCFGEGGAGTYSDGKLYTRSTKRGDVQKVLNLMVQHGAGEEILADAHPHIGTNKLPAIIENIRETILTHGGEIHFETRLKQILRKENKLTGIVVESVIDGAEREMIFDELILATGHSARDVFKLLRRENILIEAKPFAMGVRVEHPQELIDAIQYHCTNAAEVEEKRRFLPAASYSLVHQSQGRGVYSFCMCPGGIIAPCATAAGEVVVNGWSPSKRNNPFANSGVVVGIELSDLKGSNADPLRGMDYQHSLEEVAFEAGGRTQRAPAQRLTDFVNGAISPSLPATSYQPGITSAPLHDLLPSFISKRLQEAFVSFGKKMKGYLTDEAVVHGVESRTSSPVRIPRNKETLQHPEVEGLYPAGEGAGYAGGIVSAAIDGQLVAANLIARYKT